MGIRASATRRGEIWKGQVVTSALKAVGTCSHEHLTQQEAQACADRVLSDAYEKASRIFLR